MNRMFQVIVVGGISLTGYACGRGVVVEGGSGAGGASFGSAEHTAAVTVGAGGFPNEGATGGASVGFGGGPGVGGAGGAGGASTAVSSSSGFGGFPQEGPMILDAGPGPTPDAGTGGAGGAPPDASFPMETAAP